MLIRKMTAMISACSVESSVVQERRAPYELSFRMAARKENPEILLANCCCFRWVPYDKFNAKVCLNVCVV